MTENWRECAKQSDLMGYGEDPSAFHPSDLVRGEAKSTLRLLHSVMVRHKSGKTKWDKC
jgi:hypothetical protein